MRFLVETAADFIHTVRLTSPGQWVLRLVTGGSLLGAAWLCAWWFPVLFQSAFVVVIVVAVVWTVAQPDSWGPAIGIATVVLWWLAGAEDAAWWQGATLATLLAVFHLTAAHCAAAPSYTVLRRAGVRGLLFRGLAYLAACVVGMGAVRGVASVTADVVPRGPVWVGLGLVAVVGAAVLVVTQLRSGPAD